MEGVCSVFYLSTSNKGQFRSLLIVSLDCQASPQGTPLSHVEGMEGWMDGWQDSKQKNRMSEGVAIECKIKLQCHIYFLI